MWYQHDRVRESRARDNTVRVAAGLVILGFCLAPVFYAYSPNFEDSDTDVHSADVDLYVPSSTGFPHTYTAGDADSIGSEDEIPQAASTLIVNLDFSESDLRGTTARQAEFFLGNFDRANLSGADFTEAYLGKATINGAILRDATFRSAELRDASMLDADLSGANFKGAILVNATLNGAVLARVNLAWGDLTIASAEYANLHAADLSNALLIGVNLRRAILSGANLSGARLHDADLRGADMHRTNLENADLRFAIVSRDQLKEACGNADTRLPASVTDVEMQPCS